MEKIITAQILQNFNPPYAVLQKTPIVAEWEVHSIPAEKVLVTHETTLYAITKCVLVLHKHNWRV